LTIDDENRLRDKVETLQDKDKEIQELRAKMAKMEESQLKITELLEVMKIAKSGEGKVGKDRTMLDEKRRVTIDAVTRLVLQVARLTESDWHDQPDLFCPTS
jgi:chromosome segregation ATPase